MNKLSVGVERFLSEQLHCFFSGIVRDVVSCAVCSSLPQKSLILRLYGSPQSLVYAGIECYLPLKKKNKPNKQTLYMLPSCTNTYLKGEEGKAVFNQNRVLLSVLLFYLYFAEKELCSVFM